MSDVYQVVHYMLFSEDEVVSVHSTPIGAALKAQRYATATYRSQTSPYGSDPEVRWEDGMPFWEWDDNKVYVSRMELQP